MGSIALSGAAGGADAPDATVKGESLIGHLNFTIGWYHQLQAAGQWLSQPSDAFYWTTQLDLARHAVQASFAAARAELPLVAPKAAAKAAPAAARTAETERLAEATAERAARIARLQVEIAALDDQIRSAGGAEARAALQARRSALSSDLAFLESLRDALEKVRELLETPVKAAGERTLASQIDALQQSIAEEMNSAAPPAAVEAAAAKGMYSGGLIARTGALFRLTKYDRGMDRLIEANARLEDQVKKAEEPLRAEIRQVVAGGDAAAAGLETAKLAELGTIEGRIDSLSGRFKILWTALLPLREEELSFGQSRHNLERWRESIKLREAQVAKVLALRIGTILVLVAIVIAISEVWRRMLIRYINDDRRRTELLFVRRIVTGVVVLLVIATGFVSDLASLATFAGLITAGIAVALQTIIASIAAYFFLIGRYGVKVGDRITVSGVTGEVADMGLVRFYLKELVATGPNLHATGRVVTFPNSVIFQSNPVFKQLPGTEYSWHEAAVTLAPGCNAAFVREKVMAAVLAAYAEYKPRLEPPRPKAEKLSGVKIELPQPYAHIRARESGLELAVGYPVNFQNVSEIDQLVLKHVSGAIEGDADLAKSLSGHPRTGVAVEA